MSATEEILNEHLRKQLDDRGLSALSAKLLPTDKKKNEDVEWMRKSMPFLAFSQKYEDSDGPHLYPKAKPSAYMTMTS